VEQKAGTLFDADIAKSFLTMMRRWERRILPVDEGAPVTPPPREPGQPTPAEGVATYRGTPAGGIARVTPRGSGIIRS
jgi:hypothetical protein